MFSDVVELDSTRASVVRSNYLPLFFLRLCLRFFPFWLNYARFPTVLNAQLAQRCVLKYSEFMEKWFPFPFCFQQKKKINKREIKKPFGIRDVGELIKNSIERLDWSLKEARKIRKWILRNYVNSVTWKKREINDNASWDFDDSLPPQQEIVNLWYCSSDSTKTKSKSWDLKFMIFKLRCLLLSLKFLLI